MRLLRRLSAVAVLIAGVSGSTRAVAQVSVRALLQATTRLGAGSGVPRAFRVDGTPRLAPLIELPPGVDARTFGLVRVAPGFATVDLSPSALRGLGRAHPDWSMTWSPPRHPLLDRAADWIEAPEFHADTGDTGQGAIVGIVDTGVDPTHPDLRTSDGHTRIAWLLDLSRSPAGLHPDLESEYGCNGKQGYTCAIYDAQDLDRLIAGGMVGAIPQDTFGHGTHVASLAAGNGLSNHPPRYIGVAPDATIIAARVTRSGSDSILDSDILLATRFVFDRAREMGMPAVVNLSLGSDFGPHDGSSPLERGLAAFLGQSHPGRAVVVAAGNSATLLVGGSSAYPQPYGSHTEVHVPRDSSVRVPVLTPPASGSADSGTIYIWIGERSGDGLDVGIDDQDGGWVDPLSPGNAASFQKGGLTATIFNATRQSGSPLSQSNGAVVVLDGTWPSGETFGVRLEGHGTADLWVQSEGAIAPNGGEGALFPRAMKEGTINVPGSSPALIAVGATLDRTSWVDRDGHLVQIEDLGSVHNPQPDSSAYFSSAGPNALGQIKPDLVAPGVFVIGAMAAAADPSKNGGLGMFAASDVCSSGSQCLVVDDYHAVGSGTSMSAPIVSGAVALMFDRDPTLTQDQVLTLLQAGARPLRGAVPLATQVGPGELDLEGVLGVLQAEKSPNVRQPSAGKSRLILASSMAHPDPNWRISGELELRDAAGRVADGFDAQRLRLSTDPPSVIEPLQRAAPGLWRFAVAAPSGSGGGTLRIHVSYDGALLSERTLPIAVDPWVSADGVTARGGCALSSSRPPRHSPFELALIVSALALAVRRTVVSQCSIRRSS